MRENKISISIFIVFFLFISGFSQSKMSKSVYNNFLSLNPLSELNIEQEIIDIISTLKDEKNGFIYCNDLKKGFFNVVKNEDGYIIQIFDGGGEKKSNVVKLKDIIKVLKKTKSKYSNDFNEQNLFNGLKSKSKCEIICNKELYNNNLIHGYTDIVMSAKWSPMFIDLEILKNVVPSGQTKILNRQRTREFMLDPNNNPANLYLDITDGVIVPDNNGNSAKIFTVDKDCHRVVFCNKDISPNNTNQYFCGFGHYGTNVNEFRYPTGITAGPPFDGYRLFYIAEYANNRIQQIGYKLNEAGQHYFGWNDIIKSNLSSPYDIVFHYGATTSNSNDDVIWFSEQGAERRIQCINKYGSYIFSFTKYIYNGFVYPISPTRLDLYSEYQNGQAIKTILAFINEYNNKIVLIHLDNQGYLSSSDPPEAFCVIDHPYPDLNGSVFSSIKFITDLPSSITNPVSLLATTKGQYGDDGEIHKYKILFHPASQWTDPVAVEYIGTVSYLTGNQTQPFHRLKNIETVYNYADIFSMEDWSDQYGLRRFRQKLMFKVQIGELII